MEVRKAVESDIPELAELLDQVLMIHHNGRPDLFKANTRKYTCVQLREILADDTRPVLVAVEDNRVKGYAFCVYKQYKNDNIMQDMTTLYVDDICVDEKYRGQGVGDTIYHAAEALARSSGCYNLTLNVWSCNRSAIKFYEKMGLETQKIGLERILNRR